MLSAWGLVPVPQPWGASPHPWPGCSPMAARLSCSATAWPPRGSPLPGSSLAEGPAPGLQGWPPSWPCTPLPDPASYLLSSPQELSQPLTRRDPASPLMGPPRVTSRQALSPQHSMQPSEFPPSPGRPPSQDTRLAASTGTDLGCPILFAHVASIKLVLPTPPLCLQHHFLGSHPTPGTWPESF